MKKFFYIIVLIFLLAANSNAANIIVLCERVEVVAMGRDQLLLIVGKLNKHEMLPAIPYLGMC